LLNSAASVPSYVPLLISFTIFVAVSYAVVYVLFPDIHLHVYYTINDIWSA